MEFKDYKDWHVAPVLKIRDRNNYGYRVTITYEDGSKKTRQYSGFQTKREAEDARQYTIGELTNGTYIVEDRIKFADFLNYWLEYDIRQRAGSSNTYESYANVSRNHIIPILGNKRLTAINQGDVLRLYKKVAETSKSTAKLVKVVMNVSLDYAVKCHLLAVNPANGVGLPIGIETAPYHTVNIDTTKTLNLEQIQMLIEASKDTPIHMQILFNVLMGLRRQEINAVKYSDIDYVNRTLTVERQLGKDLDREPYGSNIKTGAKSELPLKTYSSHRVLPIPDYVFEAILEERKVYEKNRRRRGKYFLDGDYICCSTYGKPRSKDFHWPHYKKLLKDLGLPDIRWHDLRATYCTLLLKNDFSPKAVSQLMGHSQELITMDVYGDNANIIPEELPELEAYINDVLPDKTEKEDYEQGVENIEIDTTEYFSDEE